ncbi:MAG: response regulator [Prolixibacteraceae bacterium]|nr:response regulator [Prolixibacteraceae bacterium]
MAKILIIEDTIQLRESIADVLEQEGFEVLLADDGDGGIKLALEHSPDLILCDIVMPGMNGFDVIKQLKLEREQISTPFIFITALAERKDYREGMTLGADDYLVKPFTIEELLNAVNTRLEKHNSVEKQIRMKIEQIENDLIRQIEDLKTQNENQRLVIGDISATNEHVLNQLAEKQAQIMHEALRSIEVNTTLQQLSKYLTDELKQKGITEVQRLELVNLRNKIKKGSVLLNNWTVFQLKFNQTYPNFTSRLVTRFPQLSQQDLIIVSALFINLNTHQLSTILGISPDSVRKSKYRLKKKLGMGKEVDLLHAIHNIFLTE